MTTGAVTIWSLALVGFCVLTVVGRDLNFRAAALTAGQGRGFVGALIRHPLLWAGAALWAMELVAWLLVLEHTRLALAYPVMTLTYAGAPLVGALVLNEPLTKGQKMGAVLVAVGALCVALSDFKGFSE